MKTQSMRKSSSSVKVVGLGWSVPWTKKGETFKMQAFYWSGISVKV